MLTHPEEFRSVAVKVASLSIGHDALVELSDLGVLARVALMLVVRVSRYHIVRNLEGSLCNRRIKAWCPLLCHRAVHGGMVAVGEIGWLSSVVRIHPHTVWRWDRDQKGDTKGFDFRSSQSEAANLRAVEIVRRVVLGHEGAIDRTVYGAHVSLSP